MSLAGASVSWDDIAGQDAAKRLIQEVICWPAMNPHIFKVLVACIWTCGTLEWHRRAPDMTLGSPPVHLAHDGCRGRGLLLGVSCCLGPQGRARRS